MADVKAGVAYVDVRLGSIEQFKNKLKQEIESAAVETSKKLGDEMAKTMVPEGTKVGKVTSMALSKGFFTDAKQSFMGGLRALGQMNISTFGALMKDAGLAGGLGLKTAFDGGIKALPGLARNVFARVGGAIKGSVSGIGSAFSAAFTKMPGMIKAASTHLDNFSKKAGFLSFQLQNFGFIASTAFTAPVAGALAFGSIIGIKTAAQIEQATASLKALTPAGTDVEALIKRLQNLAKSSPIFNTSDVITFTQKMVASGLSVQTVEKFLKGFGNVALTVGADVSKIPFALEALVQMVGKGKVSMEELRMQLGDALPGAMKLVADGLGVTTEKLYAMVKAGDLTGQDVVEAFTKLGNTKPYLEGAAKGAETLGSKWQALKESVQTQLGDIFLNNADKIKSGLDKLGPALSDLIKSAGPVFDDLVNGFTGLVNKVKELIDWYNNLSPGQQDLLKKFVGFLAVLGPIVIALGALGGAIAGILAGVGALLTPVGGIILLIIGAGIAIWGLISYLKDLYKNSDTFKEKWDAAWTKAMELLQPIKDKFKEVWDGIKSGIEQIKSAVDAVRDKMGSFSDAALGIGRILAIAFGVVWSIVYGLINGIISAIGPIFKAIGSLISGIIKFFGGLITFISGVFTGNWQKALDGLRLIWDGLWDAVVGTLVNLVKALWNLVKGLVTGIVDFFKWLWDVLVGHSIIPDMVNAIIDWFKKMWQKGVDLVKKLGKPFKDFYNDHIKPFIDGVKRGADKVVEFIGKLPGKIKDFFSNAASWLIDAGKDIVNGLVEGVKRMAGVLKNAILNLIPGPVRDIVAKALGINSPSKVFAEMGKNVVLGFIRGIEGMSASLDKTVNRRFGAIPAGVSPVFGDPRNPIVEARGVGPAVQIENYYGKEDPYRVAEDFWFLVNARGGSV